MNKQKNNKGITLIALIITIIVLLILAVVAINTVNNAGIIQYAQNAVDDYEKGQEKENSVLQEYMKYLDENGGEDDPEELTKWEKRGLTSEYVQFDKTYTNETLVLDEQNSRIGAGIKLRSDGTLAFFVITGTDYNQVDNDTIDNLINSQLFVRDNFICINWGPCYITFEFVEDNKANVYWGDNPVTNTSGLQPVGIVTVE